MMAGERIHGERAALYDRIYEWLDYEKEAAWVRARLSAEGVPDGARVLEGACGTGSFLRPLSRDYRVEGFDLADGMLAVAREKCPDVPVWRADLVDFTLDEPVDAFVCLFSSIGYVGPLERFEAAARRIAAALRPGGVALIQPWFTPDSIQPGHASLTTYQGEDLKLARASVVRVDGRRTILDMHWLVARRGAPEVEHFVDPHVLWVYTPDELESAFRAAGLDVRFDCPSDSPVMASRGLLVARRRA